MTLLSNRTFQVLHKAMDAASLRQKVIAHNIANINTPGYKRAYVSFEESLQKALAGGKGLAEVTPQVKRDRSTSNRWDGNNVNLEAEMAQLAMNTINYNLAVNRLNGKLNMLSYIINGGRA